MKQRFTNSTMGMSLKFSSMQHFLKKMAVLAALVISVQVSHGFALRGPFEPYQVPAIGYRWDTYFQGIPGGVVGYSDAGGPHNIAEEFRRNTPVMYYAFNANFLEFFGSNGVAAVDQAFQIMNSLTNVSQYSDDLSEFPLTSQRINYQAQNLFMTDLKSMTLHLLVQHMGLDSPDRYTWTLKDRTMGTPCPQAGQYLVIMRNFDFTTPSLQQTPYSAYVNGTLYSYGIVENCGTALIAYTVPYAVDPLADTWTAVASQSVWIGTSPNILYDGHNAGGVGLHVGGFYTYLTRDDVSGLRYLLQTNNINLESSGPDTVQFVTNNTAQFLVTQDLGLLIAQGKTNGAVALQALYPGLQVTDTTNWFSVVYTPVVSLVITTAPPLAPAGTFLVVAVTNIVPSIVQFFGHTFDNIITNTFSRQSVAGLQIVSPGNSPFSPAGSPPTLQTTTVNFTTKNPAGDFYIIPPGLCAIKIINKNLLTTVVATTNTTFTLTNTVAAGTSNQTLTVSTINYFTNHAIVYLPVTCPPDTVGLRQGIERVHFVRRDFDSLIGTFWAPQTNIYTLVELTNSVLRSQQIRRVVNQPDFLFSADDLAGGPQQNPFPIVDTVLSTALRFNQVAVNGLAGPGTIQSPTTFTFNKVGALNENYFDFALAASSLLFVSDQSSAIRGLVWASYDGTTNDPVIYPNGTSLANLVNQFVIQIQPTSLPRGTNGTPYSFVYTNSISRTVYTNTFSVNGGQSPYTWSLAPSSAGLPSGLNLSSDGQMTGTPSGVSHSTIYDFTVRVTDAGGRFVDAPLFITIRP